MMVLTLNVFYAYGQSFNEQVDSLNQLISSSNNTVNIAKWKLETAWFS